MKINTTMQKIHKRIIKNTEIGKHILLKNN